MLRGAVCSSSAEVDIVTKAVIAVVAKVGREARDVVFSSIEIRSRAVSECANILPDAGF